MVETKRKLIVILAGLTVLMVSPMAVSDDGRLEINQTCAENGGDGFDVWSGSVMRGSTVYGNGSLWVVFSGSASLVDSTISNSDQYGLNCGGSVP